MNALAGSKILGQQWLGAGHANINPTFAKIR